MQRRIRMQPQPRLVRVNATRRRKTVVLQLNHGPQNEVQPAPLRTDTCIPAGQRRRAHNSAQHSNLICPFPADNRAIIAPAVGGGPHDTPTCSAGVERRK